jgi:hypothetical protein
MEAEFNLNHLVSVRVNDLYKSRDYKYREESFYKDFFFSKPKKIEAGIYYSYWSGESFICSLEDFPKDKLSKRYVLINNEIFEKVEIVLTFSNKDVKKIYMDSLEEAKIKAEELKKSINCLWI